MSLKIDLGHVDHLDARIKVNKSAIGICADFYVHYLVQLTCFRCMNTFTKEFNSKLTLTYVQGDDPYENAEKINLKKHDLDKIYYVGTQIDLSIGIREAVMLSIPIIILCKDTCRGLCPVCGKNKNTDHCECKVKEAGLFTPASEKKKGKRIRH